MTRRPSPAGRPSPQRAFYIRSDGVAALGLPRLHPLPELLRDDSQPLIEHLVRAAFRKHLVPAMFAVGRGALPLRPTPGDNANVPAVIQDAGATIDVAMDRGC